MIEEKASTLDHSTCASYARFYLVTDDAGAAAAAAVAGKSFAPRGDRPRPTVTSGRSREETGAGPNWNQCPAPAASDLRKRRAVGLPGMESNHRR